MLYVFFVIACLFSNYMIAMQNDNVRLIENQANEVVNSKDHREIAKEIGWDKEGYIVVGDNGFMIPLSALYVAVPIGNDGGFMSLPHKQATSIVKDIEKREMKKNNSMFVNNK